METTKQEQSDLCNYTGPHSLGKLIEWKLGITPASKTSSAVPTRWGNSLNGNRTAAHAGRCGCRVPTRWGNSLNGNLLEP